MLAIKCECATTARAILDFGVDPAVILRRDADGSTPLHIAVQNTNTAIIELLLQYGPTEILYIENSVGQTPLDIASLKNLPRVTAPVGAGRPLQPQANIDYQLRTLKNSAPFDVVKQKVEIPKLRATLDSLLADGHLVRDTKLATELLAFLGHMEGKLAIEMARKSAAGKDTEGDGNDVNTIAPRGTTASTYALLRDAVAAWPGHRQLVHLTDVQHSVKRCLTQEAEKALFASSRRIPKSDEESKGVDPEEQRVAELKSRSMFGSASTNPRVVPYRNLARLFGEDRF
jgi:hypothetical protein